MNNWDNVKKFEISEGEVVKATRNGEVVWQRKYKRELEYIKSTGTQYIDTGFIPNTDTKLELYIGGLSDNTFSTTSGGWFIGSRTNYMVDGFGTYYNPSQQQLYGAFGNQQSSVSVPKSAFYVKDHLFVIDKSGLYLNNLKRISFNSTFTGKYSLFLFTINLAGGTANLMSFKMYYCKIWDKDILVHDFIPVLDNNNVACLYDKVNDELYYNAGSGEFEYSEIEEKIEEVENA